MIDKRDWCEFKETGLLLFINQILHVFGWAICYEIDEDNICNVYPARVKFRGFDNKNVSESYKNITEYLQYNIDDLVKESEE